MTDAEFVISVLLSMKVFAACADFRPLCFVPQPRDFWSAHASSRRFWGRRPLIEKRCEDASHSQSTSCKMPCRISTGVHVRSSKDRMVHLRLQIRQTILIDWPGAIDSAGRFPGSSYSRSLDHVQWINWRAVPWLRPLHACSRSQRCLGNGRRALHQCALGRRLVESRALSDCLHRLVSYWPRQALSRPTFANQKNKSVRAAPPKSNHNLVATSTPHPGLFTSQDGSV